MTKSDNFKKKQRLSLIKMMVKSNVYSQNELQEVLANTCQSYRNTIITILVEEMFLLFWSLDPQRAIKTANVLLDLGIDVVLNGYTALEGLVDRLCHQGYKSCEQHANNCNCADKVWLELTTLFLEKGADIYLKNREYKCARDLMQPYLKDLLSPETPFAAAWTIACNKPCCHTAEKRVLQDGALFCDACMSRFPIECCVCLENITHQDMHISACHHYTCKSCYEKRINDLCSTCRQQIS